MTIYVYIVYIYIKGEMSSTEESIANGCIMMYLMLVLLKLKKALYRVTAKNRVSSTVRLFLKLTYTWL